MQWREKKEQQINRLFIQECNSNNSYYYSVSILALLNPGVPPISHLR